MRFATTSAEARRRVGQAARERAAALAPRDTLIRDAYIEMTGRGLTPAVVRTHLAERFALTPQRIRQIVTPRPA